MADSVSIPTSLPIKVQVGHTQYDVAVVDGKPTVTMPLEHIAYLVQQATPSTGTVASGGVVSTTFNASTPEVAPTDTFGQGDTPVSAPPADPVA